MVKVSIAEQHLLRDQWIATQGLLRKERDAAWIGIRQQEVTKSKRKALTLPGELESADGKLRKSRKVSIDIKSNTKNKEVKEVVCEKEIKETIEEMKERCRAKRKMDYMKVEALRGEYERCFPKCTIPNYHIPFLFIDDLKRGETLPAHERDETRISVDGRNNWNKTWCDKELTYVERTDGTDE